MIRKLVGVLGELLITVGVILMLFVAWQFWWTDVEADRAHASTVTTLERDFAKPAPPPSSLIRGEAFGVVRIPRFGADYARPVVEGTGRDDLKKGFGHYPSTAMPGGVGNLAIAGHRNTFGKPLARIHELKIGDRIIVETRAGWYVYAVYERDIVRPWESDVILPVPREQGAKPVQRLLTFTACHPPGGESHRYIIHAQLIEARTRAQGPPSASVAASPVPPAPKLPKASPLPSRAPASPSPSLPGDS